MEKSLRVETDSSSNSHNLWLASKMVEELHEVLGRVKMSGLVENVAFEIVKKENEEEIDEGFWVWRWRKRGILLCLERSLGLFRMRVK